MSQHDFDNFHSDGEWDDAGEIAWSESEWQRYLCDSEKEIARFITVYNSVMDKPDCLDEAAHLMGWDREDWAVGEEDIVEDGETIDAEGDIFDTSAPYTIHRHPVYVASIALYVYVRKHWEHFLSIVGTKAKSQFVWEYASSLRDGEMHALLGVQCLDLGDNQLAVCHFKQAHSSLNETLRMNSELSQMHAGVRSLPQYQEAVRKRLLDLREIWLRVIQECRR
ncbi:MAG: hypothetical protein CMI32_03290 [Opitutales bacterium]|nr:hypothetical protein [Opitutales bacterium]|tara:strand:+ start:208 stop:876 length:669 start_codon:yes stop_codon:yes gene_type:complete